MNGVKASVTDPHFHTPVSSVCLSVSGAGSQGDRNDSKCEELKRKRKENVLLYFEINSINVSNKELENVRWGEVGYQKEKENLFFKGLGGWIP